MTDDELQKLVQRISMKNFHRPFCHRATFNSRLRTTGGRYLLRSHCLEFNPRQLQYFGMEAFIKIVKHELCHYHLHLCGAGYKHGDADFKALLRQVGGSRYCEAIPGSSNTPRRRYVYQCRDCGLSFVRWRRLDTKRYVCGSCGGRITLIRQEEEAKQ
ncbi:SprT family protein [Sporolactobacillus sp. THM7-7]|nr:SprT family protein [Sporolactobacillus sp. THM7-7]